MSLRIFDDKSVATIPSIQPIQNKHSANNLNMTIACIAGIIIGAALFTLMGGFGMVGLLQNGGLAQFSQWLVNQIKVVTNTGLNAMAGVGLISGVIVILVSSYFLHKQLKSNEQKISSHVGSLGPSKAIHASMIQNNALEAEETESKLIHTNTIQNNAPNLVAESGSEAIRASTIQNNALDAEESESEAQDILFDAYIIPLEGSNQTNDPVTMLLSDLGHKHLHENKTYIIFAKVFPDKIMRFWVILRNENGHLEGNPHYYFIASQMKSILETAKDRGYDFPKK